MISHDMDMITKTNAVLWVCGDGNVIEFQGTYQDYVAEILENLT